ncbi:MAG TPA: hypothetical protein VKR27_05250, partial [Acidimicrobiales bacterium]|nr:hypothetical protein [Acidimicrobiales bacterium]
MRRRASKGGSAPSATSVAFRATLIAIVVYVLACFVVDVLAIHHADETLDARLATRSQQLAKDKSFREPGAPTLGSSAERAESPQSGDFDAAPVLAWGIPSGTTHITELVSGSPTLSAGIARRFGFLDATIAGKPFRVLI